MSFADGPEATPLVSFNAAQPVDNPVEDPLTIVFGFVTPDWLAEDELSIED